MNNVYRDFDQCYFSIVFTLVAGSFKNSSSKTDHPIFPDGLSADQE